MILERRMNVELTLLLMLSGASFSISYYIWRNQFVYGLWLFWSVTFLGLMLDVIGFFIYEGWDSAMISIIAAFLCIVVTSFLSFKFVAVVPTAKSIIFENMGEGVVVLDTKNRILDINHRLEKIVNIKKSDVVGISLEKVTSEWLKKAVQGDGPVRYSITLQLGDVYYEVKSKLLEHEGKVVGRVVVLSNITSRILAEQRLGQLLQSEEKLLQTEVLAHMMFNHHQALMMIIESKTGHILEANKAAENFYQIPLVGRLTSELLEVPNEVLEQEVEQYAKVGEYQFTTRHRLASGEVKDLSVHLTTKVVGEMILSFSISEDITEKLQLEKALREAKEKAENANQAKDNFLAIISHELRTPMNGILGMAKLVLGTKLQTDQRESLELVLVSGEKLLGLLNDLLDLAKINDGKLELECIYFSLQDMMNEFGRLIKIKSRKKGLQCMIHIEDDVPMGLYGDPRRLQQILMNLADNAVKFTKSGLIAITVNVKQRLDGTIKLLFTVRDTGIGIPQDKINIIFHKFTQVDSSTTRKYGGTGLGLSIVKHLVESMDGVVWVESNLGKGSSFYFTIDFTVPKNIPDESLLELGSQESRKEHKNIKPLKILLVEDEFINQKVAMKLLSNQGHMVTLASNGRQGVELFSTEHFDVIFMDIQMPEMDGIQATAAIREVEKRAGNTKHTPIVAMTAYAMKGDRERMLAAGLDEYVSKPLDFDLLTSILTKIDQERYGSGVKDDIINQTEDEDALNSNYLEHLMTLCMDDVETVRAVISCFLDNGEQYMENIKKAVAEKDSIQLKMSAHRLKGAATYFGNQTVVDCAARLEKMGHDKQLAEIEMVFEQLQKATEELKLGLKEAWDVLNQKT